MTTAPSLYPLDDRILVRELDHPERTTTGGIHIVGIPTGPTRGQVIAVGPGRWTDAGRISPPPAKVGDVVLLAEYGPTEIDLNGETLLCVPPTMVLAIET